MGTIPVWVIVFVFASFTHEARGRGCPMTLTAMGCYRDYRGMRVLPNLIMNQRGIDGFWANYTSVLPSLICSCATKAKEMGYKYIGIQYYGECWAGDYFARPLKEKRSCIDLKFRTCQKMGPYRICSGKEWTNFIYGLQEPTAAEPVPTKAVTAKPTTEATTSKPVTTQPITAVSTARPTQANRTINCKKPLDIAFVVDASGSIGNKSFQLVKSFLREFTHYFNVSTNGTHFACLHYDHHVYMDFTFNDTIYHNSSVLDMKLDSMPYPSGATRSDQALWGAYWLYRPNNGARDYHDIPRCVLVLTDGKTFGGMDYLKPPVAALKKSSYAKIVAVGIGWEVDLVELRIMAGEDHYVFVDRFENLADHIREVLGKVCD